MKESTLKEAIAHGLKEDEYKQIIQNLGRTPNFTEMGIFSAMWSEHCSYKSTKRWLKTLPTTAPWVICGPGENAGIIDIGDGDAAIFKIESHNHPSFIEPYQGAATGVGGILRDVFTMGARPFALLNALRFGDPSHPKTKSLLKGVVKGIGGYGNCVGIPTIGGETEFHSAYNGNILVNAMAIGLAKTDKIFYAKAGGIGSLVTYVGAKTGRDGIHGASMSSQEFNDESESKRPTVQVGDPFKEKLLLEACLELMAEDAIIAIQDMGAAGLTSSSIEMAEKGGVGIELEMDKIPTREAHMTTYEMMLSESQERMLVILKPDRADIAQRIFDKWDLDFAVIGKITDTGRLVLSMNGTVEADIPIAAITEHLPDYDRPWTKPAAKPVLESTSLKARSSHVLDDLKELMGSHHFASRAWIWEQYDHMVMNDTVERPGSDAGVARIHGTKKALAATTDCNPRYCFNDPKEGAKQAVMESWRNLISSGALPMAVTNNLNFGNPEKPEVMGQIVMAIEGIKDACLALDYPVISGNVSMYNETSGIAIYPTPVIGGVGLLKDANKVIRMGLRQENDTIYLVGNYTDPKGWMGSSLYAAFFDKQENNAPPPVDLATEKKIGLGILAMRDAGLIASCHDVSSGGLLIALAEKALKGDLGFKSSITQPASWWFGEDQGRYVVSTSKPAEFESFAQKQQIPLLKLGMVGGQDLTIGDQSLNLDVLRKIHGAWFKNYVKNDAAA